MFCKFCKIILTPQVGAHAITGGYYLCDDCWSAHTSASNLNALSDVSTASPTHLDVLEWDTASSKWIYTTSIGIGSSAPNTASYVTIGSEGELTNETLHKNITGADLHTPQTHSHVESDISDLDHDAQKIKTKTVDSSSIGDGKILVYRTASSTLVYETQSGGGNGGTWAPTDSSYVTVDAEASLSNEYQHQNLTGSYLHVPQTHSHEMSEITDHTSTEAPHVSSAEKTTWDGKIANVVEDISPELGANLDGGIYNFSTSGTISGVNVTSGASPGHDHVEADVTDLSHVDVNAIHDNSSSEISAIGEKGTPVDADLLVIEDSADSNAKKRIQIGNLPGGGGATFAISGAEAFSGSSPTSWTDLDLSSIVGSNSAMVLLRFNKSSDMNALSVRMNGDTNEYYNASIEANAYGMALGHHDADADLVLMCTTDTNGVIEWQCETGGPTAYVYVIAYIK